MYNGAEVLNFQACVDTSGEETSEISDGIGC
jgi:hypothetical protein